MRDEFEKYVKLNIEILVLGPDSPKSFKDFWKRKSMPFIGLPDPSHKVLNLYGQELKILKLGRMPAQVLIDQSGLLKYVYYGKSMADIPGLTELENSSGN